MSKSHNDLKIDYIEFNVSDVARTRAFYGQAFDWRFKDYGPDYCEFGDGRLTGGFTTLGPVKTGGPLILLYADDLEDAVKSVEAAGGRITQQPYGFPGGRRFHFADPDGYELAVWTADKEG